LIGTAHVSTLAPSLLFQAQFNVNTSSLQESHNYTIEAEATIVPYEYNITDNIFVDGLFKVRLLGDVNDDGLVNLKDVFAASLAFGSHAPPPVDPRWNPYADMNNDGRIDLKDYFITVLNFGRRADP
jgi:hypothetical protein